MLNKIADFLFGKAPDIFDADGNVVHKFPPQKWQQWNDRFSKNREYDWHQHTGTKRQIQQPKPKGPA